MTPWFLLPSCNADNCRRVFPLWKERGYSIAVLLNGAAENADVEADYIARKTEYLGWGPSINMLCVLAGPHEADWVVAGGDDQQPEKDATAADIAAACTAHFMGTLGVMQPTGDRWMVDQSGRGVMERICGSPWLGREFRERANGGVGPFWPGYAHFGADDEMMHVTKKLGILWQAPQWTQFHDHWLRKPHTAQPDYMKAVYAKSWDADIALLKQRMESGFPGHELLPVVEAA